MTSTDLSIGIAHGKDTVSDLICSKGIHQGFFDFDTYSTVVFACESKPRQQLSSYMAYIHPFVRLYIACSRNEVCHRR